MKQVSQAQPAPKLKLELRVPQAKPDRREPRVLPGLLALRVQLDQLDLQVPPVNRVLLVLRE